MDINKDSKQLNPDAGLGELLAKTDLLDLHWHHFPSRPTPPMHQRGSKTIDVILGSLVTGRTPRDRGGPRPQTMRGRHIILLFNQESASPLT